MSRCRHSGMVTLQRVRSKARVVRGIIDIIPLSPITNNAPTTRHRSSTPVLTPNIINTRINTETGVTTMAILPPQVRTTARRKSVSITTAPTIIRARAYMTQEAIPVPSTLTMIHQKFRKFSANFCEAPRHRSDPLRSDLAVVSRRMSAPV